MGDTKNQTTTNDSDKAVKRTKDIQTEINIADWAEAISRRISMEDGFTVRELAGKLGLAHSTMRQKMQKLKQQGKVDMGTKYITDTRGARMPVLAYKLK